MSSTGRFRGITGGGRRYLRGMGGDGKSIGLSTFIGDGGTDVLCGGVDIIASSDDELPLLGSFGWLGDNGVCCESDDDDDCDFDLGEVTNRLLLRGGVITV